MKPIIGGLIVAALLIGAGISQTDAARLAFGSAPPPRAQGQAAPSGETARFIVAASTQAAAQIELATLAPARTSSAAVLDLARELAIEQSNASRQLLALAPQAATTADAGGVRPLAGLNGRRFDRAYLDLAIQDQQRLLELCAKQARNPGPSDITAFVASWIPDLRRQLQHLHRVAAEVAILPLDENPVHRGAAKHPPRKATAAVSPPTVIGSTGPRAR